MNRVGFYHWAGPGIIDLLEVKYPDPKIDLNGHFQAYDLNYLKKAKDILGITDIWTTYSWGFSESKEQTHRQFIADKLPLIKNLGLRVYGYVQGFNLVTQDFQGQDIFCRDFKGKLLPYSKGRSFTCPNNPQAIAIIKDRISKACQLDFDAIYIDNIFFGLHPFFVSKKVMSFFGCSCSFCQKKFKQIYGYDLPLSLKTGARVIADYLEFRTDSTLTALKEFSQITHNSSKDFGVNLYDFHRHNSKVYFGYDFAKIEPLLDYYLFGNHSFKNRNSIDNSYLHKLVSQSAKPIFVLSYDKGIGCESGFRQEQMDLIYTEADKIGYAPCIKGSEYTTKGIWHVLNLSDLHRPQVSKIFSQQTFESIKNKKLRSRPMLISHIKFWNYFFPGLMRFIYNNKLANWLLHRSGIYTLALKSIKNYDL